MMQGLDRGHGPDGVHRVRHAFEAVADHEERVRDASVLQVGQHGHPELCGLPTAVAGPHPQDVLVPVQVDPDRGVDRPVADLTVADLDNDRVDEHRRVDPLQRPVDQEAISSSTLSVIRLMVSLDTAAP